MKESYFPIFTAPCIVSNRKTVFQKTGERVTVEAPGNLMKQLIQLCDGTRTHERIIQILGKKWEKDSVEGLMGGLFKETILLDARCMSREAWRIAENPMRFPTNVTDKDVAELVRKAYERHQSESTNCNYFMCSNSHEILLAQRRSIRSFSGKAIPLQSLINLLWSAYGEFTSARDRRIHRTVPSAGALYPLVVHVALFTEIGEIQSGVYAVSYGPCESVGLKIISKDVLRFSRAFLNPTSILNGTQGVIVISGAWSITGEKYGNRSMLYVPLEAGHAAQNILIEAVERGVATLEVGGFIDALLGEAVNLPSGYQPLTTIVFGMEGKSPNPSSSIMEISWTIPMAGNYRPPFITASARVSSARNWSHGRDASPQMAQTKAIAEAKEWASCGCIPDHLKKASFIELEGAVDPRNIVRFHPSQYRVKGFPFKPFSSREKYEWVEGHNIVLGSTMHILADLVYFPYFPETPYYAFSNSSGCAAHPDKQIAIEKATLELVERDAFMNAYMCRLKLPTVAQNTLPDAIQERINHLQAHGFRVWIIDHSIDLAPVIFIFVQNEALGFTACASSASFSIENAMNHAFMEVEASILSRLQSGPSLPIKPNEVGTPRDHGRLYEQKQYFRHADFMVNSNERIPFSRIGSGVAHTWKELLTRFERKKWQLLIIPLHLSGEYGGNEGMHIIRSIVPGMVPMTFGYRQEPAGMERVYTITKEFGGKKLSYQQLTKFPHPFA